MIRTLTCIEVTCDDCGEECWEDADCTPHWESTEKLKASDWLGDWLFTDTEQVCNRCHAKRVCAAEGHDWDDWKLSQGDTLTVWRSCERCAKFDATVNARAGGGS